MPEISVIIPVYNAEKYLQRCIDSIKSQDYSDYEVLLVDDGSTDSSGQICDNNAKLNKKITVIHQKNRGASAARNVGIKRAEGKYIQMLDADDYLDKNTLAKLSSKINLSNADVIIFGIRNIKIRNGKILNESLVSLKDDKYDLREFLEMYSDLLPKAIIGASCNKLYRRSLLLEYDIKYNETIRNNEDTYFNYDVLIKCEKIVTVSDVFYNYVDENEQSASKKVIPNLFEVYLGTYHKATDFLINADMYQVNEKFLKQYFAKQVMSALINVTYEDISQKDEWKSFKKIIYNNEVNQACNTLIETRLDRKFILFCIKKKNVLLALCYVKIRNFIRRWVVCDRK